MATILIVDDQLASRMALWEVLGSTNHRVVEARDGVEGLAKVRAEHFDLVICDLILPKTGGYEFVRQLRGDPALASTPVVFWVAPNGMSEAQSLARACGVRHLLYKRSEPAEILKTVAAALGEPLAAVELGPEFDRAYVNLITEKLTQKMSELQIAEHQLSARSEVGRTPHSARPILVVEDNPMDLDFMLQAFAESSVANPVHVCRDGEEALQFMETHQTSEDADFPLLVLLDLRLPKVDGIEVLRQARQHPVWKQVPFVVVTTSCENSDIASAYQLGINSYIVKPVSFIAFAEMVKHIKVYWLLTNEPPFSEPDRRK